MTCRRSSTKSSIFNGCRVSRKLVAIHCSSTSLTASALNSGVYVFNFMCSLLPTSLSIENVQKNQGTSSAPARVWLDKVRSIQPQQPLLPPRMDEECQRIVYLALMQDRQLKLHYRKRDADAPTVYASVHPLAVVQRGGMVYLVCMFSSYDDVRTLALHRVHAAEALYEPARKKAGFNIDTYIASGQFGVITGEPVNLRATFTRAAGEHLFETPLSDDQVLTNGADSRLHLSATVPNTRALVWWLLGFGDGVVVHEPSSLRDELAGIATRMAAAYAR